MDRYSQHEALQQRHGEIRSYMFSRTRGEIWLFADFAALAVSGALIRRWVPPPAADTALTDGAAVLAGLLGALLARHVHPGARLGDMGAVIPSIFAGAGAVLATARATGGVDTVITTAVGLWCLAAMGWFAATHLGALAVAGWSGQRQRERIALVGPERQVERLAKELRKRADIVAVLGPDSLQRATPAGRALADMAWVGTVDTVVVAVSEDASPQGQAALDELLWLPAEVATPSTGTRTPRRQRRIGGLRLEIVQPRVFGPWEYLAKRAIDVLVGGFAAILLLPVQVAIALLVAIDQPGAPVLFRQERMGWTGRRFMILKFRTMRLDGNDTVAQTARSDPRVTRVGRILRQSSLDELPQLWNVLVGDMSLVGPRPMAPSLHEAQVEGWHLLADFATRHRVRPGLTGWAQINGSRGAVHTEAQIRRRLALDLHYIRHWSIWLDLKIIARTPRVVLSAQDAY